MYAEGGPCHKNIVRIYLSSIEKRSVPSLERFEDNGYFLPADKIGLNKKIGHRAPSQAVIDNTVVLRSTSASDCNGTGLGSQSLRYLLHPSLDPVSHLLVESTLFQASLGALP
jgi:hypothetical protein